MNQSTYHQQVELLIRIAPIVFSTRLLALKGGTGINLFFQNMPRVSVDLDCVFLDKTLPRDKALSCIRKELERIKQEAETRGYRGALGFTNEDVKCIVSSGRTQVKIEVNPIFRGTILPVQMRPLCKRASDEFFAEYELPVLCRDEIYAGKILAALDRQHPRDIFDIKQMPLSANLSEEMIECFLIYLCAHNRPFHETLFSRMKDQRQLFNVAFAGMTDSRCSWDDLSSVRTQLQDTLFHQLGERRINFLKSFAEANPRWDLCKHKDAKNLPAIRWKLKNLQHLRETNYAKFAEQKEALVNSLDTFLGKLPLAHPTAKTS